MKMVNLFKEYEGVFEEKTSIPDSPSGKSASRVFGYSPFALQDAIGEKNVKKAWIEYEKLRMMDIEADELIHKIAAKARDMAAIATGASQEDLGLKDYPFAKSKRDLKNWDEERLKDFYTQLVTIYHQSRMGGTELDIALEKLLLSIS